jgi:hypothetical protein
VEAKILPSWQLAVNVSPKPPFCSIAINFYSSIDKNQWKTPFFGNGAKVLTYFGIVK